MEIQAGRSAGAAFLAATLSLMLAACGGGGGGGSASNSGGGNGGGGGGGSVTQGTFSATGSLTRARAGHTATLLPNGKVLIVGPQTITGFGAGAIFLPYTELYSPATGTSTAIDDARNGLFPQLSATAALTALFSGRVLLSTGITPVSCNGLGEGSLVVVVYDPTTDTYTGGEYNDTEHSQYDHTATLLSTGKVLMAGGFLTTYAAPPTFCRQAPTATAVLYDPVTATDTATGSMITDRVYHTATMLQNGKVLITGGGNNSIGALAVAELYDPATGVFTATGSMTTGRSFHTATLLANGKVLVTGGISGLSLSTDASLASAELYDPATGTFSATGSMSDQRFEHTATLLSNGTVLVAGGQSNASGTSTILASADLFDPTSGTFIATGSMATARVGHTATLLGDGRVLIAGGSAPSVGPVASAEVFQLN